MKGHDEPRGLSRRRGAAPHPQQAGPREGLEDHRRMIVAAADQRQLDGQHLARREMTRLEIRFRADDERMRGGVTPWITWFEGETQKPSVLSISACSPAMRAEGG